MAEVARKRTEVAVGILVRTDGALLLTTRPPDKVYGGYWEFPGGKIEGDETVEQALRRELHEELGITIGPASVWKVTEHDYRHALVGTPDRRYLWLLARDPGVAASVEEVFLGEAERQGYDLTRWIRPRHERGPVTDDQLEG